MFWNVKFWQNLAWWNPLLKLAWAKTDQMNTKRGFRPSLAYCTPDPPASSAAQSEAGRRSWEEEEGATAGVSGLSPRSGAALPTLVLSHPLIFSCNSEWDWPGLSWCRVISVMWQQQQQQQQQQHHLQQQQQQHGDPVACSRARPKRESDCLHNSTTGLLLLYMNLDNRIWDLCEWR